MLSREQDVVGANGVVIEAKLADSQVIVVRAHGDVLAFARRIAAREDRDDIARLDRIRLQIPYGAAELASRARAPTLRRSTGSPKSASRRLRR